MAKGAQVEPDNTDIDPKHIDADLPPRLARRASVMEGIHATRREMLREEGVTFEDDDDADSREAEPRRSAADEVGDAGLDPQPVDSAGDGDAPGEPEPAAEPEGASEEPEAEPEPEPVAEPGDEPPARQTAPQEPLVKVTIDGQEKELPLSEVVAGYQVRATADRRLEIANQTLEQAEQLRTRLIQGGGASRPAAEPDQDRGGAKPAAPLDKIDWAQLGKDLQFEDPEKAGNSLRSVVEQIITEGAADPAATRDELEAQILNKIHWQNAVDRFKSEFTDIDGDPVLRRIAGDFGDAFYRHAAQQAQQNGGQMPSYWAIWEAAGKATRDWLVNKTQDDKDLDKNPNTPTSKASPGSKPNVAINPDRTERKRAAAQPPEPRTRQTRPQQDAAPVNSEQALLASRRGAIEDMKKARGQANR